MARRMLQRGTMRPQLAVDLMMGFAGRTGVTMDGGSRRYLWTDAFAVCNFLGLHRATGEGRYAELALQLVERVHRTLGRYRDDDGRRGWITGLGSKEAEAHPTRGGLRIGKPFPERGPTDPVDEWLEWERDGQYFHYLTKWMHALDQVARATRQPMFNVWARDLAHAAHRAFLHEDPGPSICAQWGVCGYNRNIHDKFGATDMLVGNGEKGVALAEVMGKKDIVLMRAHGAEACGPTLQAAVFRAVYTEVNARIQHWTMALGRDTPIAALDDEEGRLADLVNLTAATRAWDLWRSQVRSQVKW